MLDDIAATHDGAPKREHRLIGRLRIHAVGGIGAGGAVGQFIASRQLPANDAGFHVFRRTKGGRARLHVNVRGEAAIDEGCAGPDEL